MIHLVLFGPPGSGKGTQSQKIVEAFGLVHLSTGDIFRAELKGNTPLGLEARHYLDQGLLVPDSVVISMVAKTIDAHADAAGFIFDGFPRTQAQAQALDDLLAERHKSISHVILLDVPDEELRQRLKQRALTSGRSDDADPVVIEKRIQVYKDETFPCLDFYRAQQKLVVLPGVGEVNAIFSQISSVLNS